MKKLPDKLIILPNPDKLFHEKWTKGRTKLNIPHPFRCLCFGPPNTGKTTVVKNLIMHQEPPFEEVIVIHCDAKYSKEYEDVGVKLIDKIPAPNDWPGVVKTLCVLDDLEFKGMNKQQKSALNRLFGYVSTHKNISVVLCSQDPFNTPASIRRMSNLWVLWKMADLQTQFMTCRRAGLEKDQFEFIFKNLIKKTNDSLWIDKTKNSPYPLRINGSMIIGKKIKDNMIMKNSPTLPYNPYNTK